MPIPVNISLRNILEDDFLAISLDTFFLVAPFVKKTTLGDIILQIFPDGEKHLAEVSVGFYNDRDPMITFKLITGSTWTNIENNLVLTEKTLNWTIFHAFSTLLKGSNLQKEYVSDTLCEDFLTMINEAGDFFVDRVAVVDRLAHRLNTIYFAQYDYEATTLS